MKSTHRRLVPETDAEVTEKVDDWMDLQINVATLSSFVLVLPVIFISSLCVFEYMLIKTHR